jgi:O-antigen/teichoic acid export membrane protein
MIVTVLRCAGVASTVGITAFQGRILSSSDFGFMVLLGSLAAFASLVAQLGLNRSLVRFLAQSVALHDHQAAVSCVRRGCLLAACSSGVTACLWYATIVLISPRELSDLHRIAALSSAWLVFLTFHQLIGEMLRGFGKQFPATLIAGLNGGPLVNGLYLLLLFGLMRFGPVTIVGALSAYLLAFVFVTPLAVGWLIKVLYDSKRQAGTSPSSEYAAEITTYVLVKTSFLLMLIQALSYCVSQGDLWVAGASLSADDLALYGAARRVVPLLTLPLQLGSVAIVPIIATLHAQRRCEDLQQLTRTVANLCFLPSLLPFACILLFPQLLLSVFVGPQYTSAASLLAILSVGQMVLSWSGVHGMVMMMTGQEQLLFFQTLGFSVLLLVLTAAGVFLFGVTGLAVAASLVLLIQSAASVWITRKVTGVWSHARW